MSKSISILSSLGCTFIWGTTFIAQDTGMAINGPNLFNGVIFFVGFLVLLPFFLYFEKKNIKRELEKDSNEKQKVQDQFNQDIDDLGRETESLVEEIDKWQT